MNEELFEELLEEGEGEKVDFKEYYNFENKDKKIKDEAKVSFVKDVFSFANTPRIPVESAYIILGVKDNGELVGFNDTNKDTFFQDKLNVNSIGKVPRIHYHKNFKYKGMNFGIIEIFPPDAEKEPYIPEIDFTDKIKKGSLYLRRDNQNAEANEEEKRKVYEYFKLLNTTYLKNLKSEIPIGKELTNFPSIDLNSFIGRKDELKALKKKFNNNKIIIITGIGGQGKSTLARAYITKDKSKYNHIVYLEMGISIASTFIANPTLITNLNLTEEFSKISQLNQELKRDILLHKDEKENEKSYFDLVLNKLRNLPGCNILILDDISSDLFSEIDILPKDNWHILCTSRSSIENSSVYLYKLGSLKDEDAISLFMKFYKEEVLQEELNEFLKHVDNHALLIELTAKTISESFEIDSLGEFLLKLKINIQDESINFPIHSDHSKNKEIELSEYITKVFSISKLESEEPSLLQVLRMFTYFPSIFYEGKEIIDLLESAELSKNTIAKALRKLSSKGWLQEESEKRGNYKLHPVIKLSLSTQIKNSQIYYYQLINKIHELVIEKKNKKNRFAELTLHLAKTNEIFISSPKHIELLHETINLYLHLKEFEKIIECGFFLEKNNLLIVNDFIKRGIAYSNLKDYQKAIEDYTIAIELDSNNSDAYYNRGIAYSDLNDYQKAIEDYNKAIELDLKNEYTYYRRGFAYYNLCDYQKAIEEYNKAIELDPKFAVAYNNRGYAYENLKDYQKAIEDYSKAIELDPKYVYFYFFRGFVYIHLKDYQKAIEDYTIATELDSNNSNAYYNRGIAYSDLNDYQKAIEDYNKAIELDLKNEYTYYRRGFAYYNLNEYPKAIEDYNKAIELDPKFAVAYIGRGNAFSDLKDYQKAIEDYNKVIELDLKYAGAYNNRGIVYKSLEDYQKAIEDYTIAIELDSNNSNAYYNRGIAYYDLNEYPKAIEDYNKAIELDPKDETLFQIRAKAFFYIKNYNESLKDFNIAIELNPFLESVYNNRGFLYGILKDYSNAIIDLKKAIELEPNSDFPHANLSQILFIIGKNEEAIEHLNIAFSLQPKDIRLLTTLYFYTFAHIPERREDAKLKLQELIADNIQKNGEESNLSEDWDFSANIERAITDGHSEPELLKEFARKITGKEN